MTNRCVENVCLHEETRPSLARVFHPVSRDLQAAQERLAATFTDTQNPSVRVAKLIVSQVDRAKQALPSVVDMLTSIEETTGIEVKSSAGDPAWLPVDGFLDKPVSPRTLLTQAERLLRSGKVGATLGGR